MFFLKRIIKLEEKVRDIEIKNKQAKCEHIEKIFRPSNTHTSCWHMECWTCKKKLATFFRESKFLEAKNKYIIKMVKKNKIKIHNLKAMKQ